MTTKAKYTKEEGFRRRMYVHTHNGLRNAAKLMRTNLGRMLAAESVTSKAKTLVNAMLDDAELLIKELEERVGP